MPRSFPPTKIWTKNTSEAAQAAKPKPMQPSTSSISPARRPLNIHPQEEFTTCSFYTPAPPRENFLSWHKGRINLITHDSRRSRVFQLIYREWKILSFRKTFPATMSFEGTAPGFSTVSPRPEFIPNPTCHCWSDFFLPENHPLAKNCQKITSGSSRVCLSLAEHCTDLKQALRAGCSFLPPSAHFPTATVRTSRWKSLKNTVLEIPKELLRCNVKVFPFQPAPSLCFTRSSQRSDLKPSQPRLSNRKTLGQ